MIYRRCVTGWRWLACFVPLIRLDKRSSRKLLGSRGGRGDAAGTPGESTAEVTATPRGGRASASGGVERDGSLADDLDAETLECGDVGEGVGEEVDLADAEVGEDLSAETYFAKNALGASGCVRAGVAVRTTKAVGPTGAVGAAALIAVEADAVRIDGGVEAEAG